MGAWMKVELELPDKPEVFAIATKLSIDPDLVPTKLIRVWAWFDKHTKDGNAAGVTPTLLDRITGVTGFGEAMLSVGWLKSDGGSLSVPNFDRHNGETAKSRAETALRVAKHRARKSCNASGNETCNKNPVTETVAREEKEKIEDKSKEAGPGQPAPALPADPVKEIFTRGVTLLVDAGMDSKPARSMLGKLRQEVGDVTVLAVITEAEAVKPSEPLSWMIAACKAASARARGRPLSGVNANLSDKDYGAGIGPGGRF